MLLILNSCFSSSEDSDDNTVGRSGGAADVALNQYEQQYQQLVANFESYLEEETVLSALDLLLLENIGMDLDTFVANLEEMDSEIDWASCEVDDDLLVCPLNESNFVIETVVESFPEDFPVDVAEIVTDIKIGFNESEMYFFDSEDNFLFGGLLTSSAHAFAVDFAAIMAMAEVDYSSHADGRLESVIRYDKDSAELSVYQSDDFHINGFTMADGGYVEVIAVEFTVDGDYGLFDIDLTITGIDDFANMFNIELDSGLILPSSADISIDGGIEAVDGEFRIAEESVIRIHDGTNGGFIIENTGETTASISIDQSTLVISGEIENLVVKELDVSGDVIATTALTEASDYDLNDVLPDWGADMVTYLLQDL